MQQVDYLFLCFYYALFTNRPERASIESLQIECALRSLLSTLSRKFPYYPEKPFTRHELEFDFHFILSDVEKFIYGGCPAFAPQGPGHGVKDRGFAAAVITAQAGNVDII